ncbi:hypothetical protein [Methylomonas methanica]|uniref:Uncharacterized protein n=1 Tax=Methylomonas methanica TaxID=421 RepID=A0A177LY56_METMH|nr:hypothetical protein [Methylomonas methanica]OAH98213.1 hypothetical protein A1332_20735 [Methylomonas methanica]
MTVQRRSNFIFFNLHDPQLLSLGLLAEKYFADDPNTCLLKLRQLAVYRRTLLLPDLQKNRSKRVSRRALKPPHLLKWVNHRRIYERQNRPMA